MSLAIEIGYYRVHDEDDEEASDMLAAINDVLESNGLPPHDEPKELPETASRAAVDSFPYSYLHFLRRVAARHAADPAWEMSPVSGEELSAEDEAIIEEQAGTLDNHLLCHSDAEGFYVPVDFPTVLVDEEERIPGMALGSTQRLLHDLVTIAPLLGIRLAEGRLPDEEADQLQFERLQAVEDHYAIEKTVWLTLYEACRLSLAHRALIIFC